MAAFMDSSPGWPGFDFEKFPEKDRVPLIGGRGKGEGEGCSVKKIGAFRRAGILKERVR